uniref:Bromodomain-containing protein 8 n=1 Tax=Sinocyclocheilus grahami TaxID=75366 RepID=A0A672RBU7_SINGR
MSTGVGKHKMLSLGPTEPWSVREKLCLASSVMRSGDQNWVSVSRAIKPFSEPGRPPDWFSQKHCASQYSELLETTEAPKRKRGEKGEVVETIEDVIVRRLTTERIEELKRLIKDTQEKYRKLKKEVDLIQAGHLDPKLEELWADIELKRKQEEEEAEQKKRATEAAYQGEIYIHSALSNVNAQGLTVFMPISEVTGPGPKESGLASMVDDSPQKKHLAPKATPPPSPLLSELLKKGSLIAASSRLVSVGYCEATFKPLDLRGMSQKTGFCLSQTHFPFLNFTFMSTLYCPQNISHQNPEFSASLLQSSVSHDPSEIILISMCFLLSEAVMAGSSTPAEVEGKEAELVEEDTVVSVSYMAHELDLETVGDIIAIIEEKVDDPVEALDAAAVEAALSLCEDPAVSGHPLTSPWESQTFKAAEPEPIVQQSPAPTGTQSSPDPVGVQAEMEVLVEETTETEAVDEVTGDTVASAAPVTEQSQDSKVKTEGEREGEGEGGMEEAQQENRTLSPAVKCEGEDWVQPETVTPCLDSEDSSASAKDSKEVKEEDGGSEMDVDEGMEMKECGDGDGEGPYLSEVDPPASESEDGYGSHSQRYTTADSIASSPASSQFSMCSEDQEALQAQKIWKKAIMLVWRAAANHRYASVFLQPVSDDIAPGYHSIVHRPMDLSAIKKNIESGQIRTTAEFQRDIMLMFQNAVMYNSSDHDVYHMALEMQRDVLEQIQQFLATQLIMQTSESGIGTKSLRGREANRKQDPNEKVRDTHDGGTRGRRSAIEADMKMKK